MARKLSKVTQAPAADSAEEMLKKLVPLYDENKLKMDEYKKVVDDTNKKIKAIMAELNLESFEYDGVEVVYSVSERKDFLEDKLIEKLRPYKIRGIIKKREYVDMDILESAIYHDKIDAADLTECQTVKEVATLRIKRAR